MQEALICFSRSADIYMTVSSIAGRGYLTARQDKDAINLQAAARIFRDMVIRRRTYPPSCYRREGSMSRKEITSARSAATNGSVDKHEGDGLTWPRRSTSFARTGFPSLQTAVWSGAAAAASGPGELLTPSQDGPPCCFLEELCCSRQVIQAAHQGWRREVKTRMRRERERTGETEMVMWQ